MLGPMGGFGHIIPGTSMNGFWSLFSRSECHPETSKVGLVGEMCRGVKWRKVASSGVEWRDVATGGVGSSAGK